MSAACHGDDGTRPAASTTRGRSRRSCFTRRATRRSRRSSFPAAPAASTGAAWRSIPTTGYMFVNAQNTSLVGWVEEKDPNVDYSFDARGSKQPYDRASVNGVGPFFTFSAPLNGYDASGQTSSGSAAPVSAAAVVEARRGERSTPARSRGSRCSASTSLAGRQAARRQQRQRRSDGDRRRAGLRRRDQRPALPCVRREDRQRTLDGERSRPTPTRTR